MSEPATLPELFARHRPADPSTVFLTVPAVDGRGSMRLTYGDAERRTAQLAHVLRAAGVRPGDRVAVQVEKSPDALLLYLACVRAAAVFLPMNTAYTAPEVAYLLGDARPSLFVCDPGADREHDVPTVLTLGAEGSGTLADRAAGMERTFADEPVRPSDLAAILYTSGTTGRPKGAMLTHQNLASNAAALHRAWGFRSDDVLLHALPIYHSHGLFVATNCVLANGTGMVFLPRFDVDAVLSELSGCTVFMGVPTFYTRLLADQRFTAEACRSIRLFVSGSAPLLASTHEEFRDRTGHAILERYGLTETSMNTSNPLDGERRAGTVGFPLPGVEVRVVDQVSRQPVDAGGIGEVEVRGPNVFSGYWGRPELSSTEFSANGYFRTGDLAHYDDGGYLHIVGRSKDLVISGGLNVYPKEVEDVLDGLEGVLESAVIGVPDPDFGEAVVAVVVPEPGIVVDPAGLRAASRDRLASYKVPKRVEVVEALPRNAMGKVEKAKLRGQFGGRNGIA